MKWKRIEKKGKGSELKRTGKDWNRVEMEKTRDERKRVGNEKDQTGMIFLWQYCLLLKIKNHARLFLRK